MTTPSKKSPQPDAPGYTMDDIARRFLASPPVPKATPKKKPRKAPK